jgi:hypothetical protein
MGTFVQFNQIMIPVFPTAYFGNILYFRSIIEHSDVMIESKEHFIKQTYRNRTEILTSSGVQQLSIPVIRKNGSKTVIEEVEIAFDTDWRKDHWKAIESAYSNSPYFEHYGSEVKELIYQNETNLLKFNQNILERIFSWLGIDTRTRFSEEFRNSDTNISSSRTKESIPNKDKYVQVFGAPGEFEVNLSVLDAIFCEGPMTRKILI